MPSEHLGEHRRCLVFLARLSVLHQVPMLNSVLLPVTAVRNWMQWPMVSRDPFSEDRTLHERPYVIQITLLDLHHPFTVQFGNWAARFLSAEGRNVGMLPAFAAERCKVDSSVCGSSGACRGCGCDIPDALGHQGHHHRVVPPETQGWPRFGSADLTWAILHRPRNNAGSSCPRLALRNTGEY